MILNIRSIVENIVLRRETNKKRLQVLNVITDKISKCSSKNGLSSLIKEAYVYNARYPHSKSPKIIYVFLCIAVSVVVSIYFFDDILFSIIFMLLAFGIKLSSAFLSHDGTHLKRISDEVYRKKVALEKGLINLSGRDLVDKFKLWSGQFTLFTQGDPGKKLNSVGQFSLSECDGVYYFFHFEYEKKSTSGLDKDKSESIMYYQHYGFIFPFNYEDISVFDARLSCPNKQAWKTESSLFNKSYRVSAKNQQVASIFLTPVIINMFVNLGREVGTCCFEISNKVACLSFCDEEFITRYRRYSITEPLEFCQEIMKENNDDPIDRALRFIDDLIKKKSKIQRSEV